MDNTVVIALKHKEKELIEQLRGVRSTISLFENENKDLKPKFTNEISLEEVYKEDFTWDEKILFVLNKLKTAKVSEICDTIKKYQNIPEDQLTKRVTVTASAMAKDGVLKIMSKQGVSNIYAINKKA